MSLKSYVPTKLRYRIPLFSICLTLATIPVVFLFVWWNIHDGASFYPGQLFEMSFLWPVLLLKGSSLEGPPAFFLLLVLSLSGYFAFYLAFLTMAYSVSALFRKAT